MNTRGAIIAGGVGAGLYGAWHAARLSYEADLQARMPENGDTISIIPFLGKMTNAASHEDLGVMFMGGIAKQALLDPDTIFDIEGRRIIVSDEPCHTRAKATLYRSEGTIRDVDLFTYALINGEGWTDATPEHTNTLNNRASELQTYIDSFAKKENLPRGPEVSLFGYEAPQGAFSIGHYATTTQLEGSTEVITHSLGARGTFEQPQLWHVVVDGLLIPTCSPARILGRTLTRTLVPRNRDQAEVFKAAQILKNQGLDKQLLGDEWQDYKNLRKQIDISFQWSNLPGHIEAGRSSAVNFVLAKMVAPLSGPVEASFLASAIRDPESKIGKLAAGIMGAHGNGN